MALKIFDLIEAFGSEKGVFRKGELSYEANHVLQVTYDGAGGEYGEYGVLRVNPAREKDLNKNSKNERREIVYSIIK
ncbi:unnamed protein product, partial [Nesidiocoris tenuis]